MKEVNIIRRSDCSSNFLSTALFLRWTPAATFYRLLPADPEFQGEGDIR